MASSYQPGVRRVSLEGTSSRGFAPVQAADNSQAVLQRGLSDLDALDRVRQFNLKPVNNGLEALGKLSSTAIGLLTENQQNKNDNDRKLGIADILNGEMQPKPEALQTYRENTTQLRSAAIEEQTALNNLESTRPDVAVEIRANDPVVSGWRQYGRAEGTALKATANAEMLFEQAMSSTIKNIPIVAADGSVRMIAPSEAQSMAELNAAWSVILQGFIGASGLDGINPLLLAEHVTPKIMDIKARVFSAGAKRIAAVQKDAAVVGVTARLGGALANSNLDDPKNLAYIFQFGGAEWAAAEGIPRSEADKKTLDWMLEDAIRRRKGGAINLLEQAPRAQDGSMSLGTLGTFYPDVFDAARNKLKSLNKIDADERKAAQLATVENVVKAYGLDIIGKPPNEVQRLWTIAQQTLGEMSKAGLEGASEALILHNQKPKRRVDQTVEDNFVADFNAHPGRYSKAQVEKHIADGEFSPDLLDRLKFPEDVAGPMVKPFKAQIDKAALGAITAQLSGSAFKPTDLASGEVITRSNQLGAEIYDAVLRVAAQKGSLTDEDVNAVTERIIKKALDPKTGDKRFLVNPKRSDKPGRPVEFMAPLVDKTLRVNQTRAGATALIDWSQIAPADLRGMGVKPRDQVIAPRTLEIGIETYKKTGAFPGDQQDAIRLTGTTQTEFIRAQTGEPRSLADLAQGLQLAILDNPRSTNLERVRANWEIKRKELLFQATPTPSGGVAPETAELLQSLGRVEGGAREYEAANSGTADDMRQGIPGLTSMTIDQIQGTKAHHVGKYQLQLGKGRTLDLLKQKIGLTGNEKFTPELQDRMASELIWGGWKRPELTAYLKGGGNLEKAVADFNNEWEAGKLNFDARPYLRRMRAAYQVRGGSAVGLTGNFRKENVAVVNWETKGRGDSYQKGGVDVYFNDKQFPAIAPGKVTDIGRQPDGKTSYGIYVITEHKDPKTGQTFQLINAHLDAVHVKVGDPVQVGTILGRQGSTGSTSPGGIASIDPLEPAPRGSKQTIPYRRPEVLKELLLPLLR
jgi:murein DD-endopeptidase MepM/ murein hydrolase activator NlpD